MSAKIFSAIRDFVPPIFLRVCREVAWGGSFFRGNYTTWEEAEKASTGYDSDRILDKVRDSLLKVKNGEAVYERDSVLFDKVQYSWPLLAALLWIASRNENRLNLVDFGGSLGSTYYQNRTFLAHLNEVRWNIVEQKKFVECGKRDFEDRHLKFHNDLEECVREQHPDAILLSSVLQYLEKPYDLLEKVLSHGFEYVIFDRTPFLETGGDRITTQKVPPSIYLASYPAWFFDEKKFLAFFMNHYEKIAEFESGDRSNIPSRFKGFLFHRDHAK